MALNLTGPISLGGATAGQSINLELGQAATATTSLNATNVRTLAGVASGAIIMPTNFYGKSNTATASYTFATNTANASLNITTLSGYVAGSTIVTITVNAGVYLYATSSATPGLTLTGGQSGDTITLVNNGYIMGQGGAGASYNAASGAGGPALKLGYNTTINNTNASAYIGGGGGGAGNGWVNQPTYGGKMGGGGGAGGGAGGVSWAPTGLTGSGGAGGGVGASGSNGSWICNFPGDLGVALGAGGGGGRIFSGTGGSAGNCWYYPYGLGGGSGGGGGSFGKGCQCDACGTVFGLAGNGGSANAVGGNSTGTCAASGGGGGWGASGGSSTVGALYASSAGGKAVCLNAKTVTWTGGCTTRVYGVVS